MLPPPSKNWTVIDLLNETQAYFEKSAIATPRLDAELLLASCLQKDRIRLYLDFEYQLTPEELARFRELVRRRRNKEPVAYITGFKEFWSLRLAVTPDVLIPRPDTEVLVEEVIKMVRLRVSGDPCCILDIGTGSGAIALALARELPDAAICGLDLSPEALGVAQANARSCGHGSRVEFICGDSLSAVHENVRFDAIVSNPPYIPSADIETLEVDIKNFEPRLALDGGPDGLDFYRTWIPKIHRYLKANGFAALEIGAEQGRQVAELFAATGMYEDVRIVKDFAHKQRVVTAQVCIP
jgi:release factor glutamine methyltransferase